MATDYAKAGAGNYVGMDLTSTTTNSTTFSTTYRSSSTAL